MWRTWRTCSATHPPQHHPRPLVPSWAWSAGVETLGGAALRLVRLLPNNGESVMLDSNITAEEVDLFNVLLLVCSSHSPKVRAHCTLTPQLPRGGCLAAAARWLGGWWAAAVLGCLWATAGLLLHSYCDPALLLGCWAMLGCCWAAAGLLLRCCCALLQGCCAAAEPLLGYCRAAAGLLGCC